MTFNTTSHHILRHQQKHLQHNFSPHSTRPTNNIPTRLLTTFNMIDQQKTKNRKKKFNTAPPHIQHDQQKTIKRYTPPHPTWSTKKATTITKISTEKKNTKKIPYCFDHQRQSHEGSSAPARPTPSPLAAPARRCGGRRGPDRRHPRQLRSPGHGIGGIGKEGGKKGWIFPWIGRV